MGILVLNIEVWETFFEGSMRGEKIRHRGINGN